VIIGDANMSEGAPRRAVLSSHDGLPQVIAIIQRSRTARPSSTLAGRPVIVFFDEMNSIFRSRGSACRWTWGTPAGLREDAGHGKLIKVSALVQGNPGP